MTFAASQRRQMTPLGTSSLRDRGFLHLYVMAGATLFTWLFITSMEETGLLRRARRSLKYFTLWQAIGWLFVALIVYGSLTPTPIQIPMHEGDKLGHMFSCCVSWAGSCSYITARRTSESLCCAWLWACSWNSQLASGYRDFEYLDMAADAVGVFIAWALGGTALARLLARLEQRMGAPHPGGPP